MPYLKGCLSTILSDTLDVWSTCLEHVLPDIDYVTNSLVSHLYRAWQDEFSELREALADARKEASSAQAAAAAELQTLKRQHKAAVQVGKLF